MNIWHGINPDRIQPSDFLAVIEIEKGSKKKYELEQSELVLVTARASRSAATEKRRLSAR